MIVAGSYAYYRTTISGSITASITTWEFKANNSATSFNISLAPSQTTKTLNSTMAPGTSGSFTITLDNHNNGLPVNYTITFSNFQNIPANLKFCSDSETCNTVTDITAAGYSITGTLNAGQSALQKTIYWKWPLGDSSSVTADNAAADKNVTFTATVVGQQKQ